VSTALFRPAEGKWYYRFLEIEWMSIDYDARDLAYILSDLFADWADLDDDGDIYLNSLWNMVEDVLIPEQVDDSDEGAAWWKEVRHHFEDDMEEIAKEWRAERKYGHPSLSAYERNPGLAGRRW
jgi:hypothetical protein